MTEKRKRIWHASLALIGLAIVLPQAGAQPFLYKNNDLLLGFRKTGTFQENYEAVVNIGPATNYVYAPDGSTLDVPGFTPTQLVPDCFSSLNNLNWAVCGFARTNLNFVLPGYINNTLWLTVPRTTDNVRAASPPRLAFPSQGSITVPINSIGRNAAVLSSQTLASQDNTETFIREPINSPNNYSAFMAAVADSTGSTLNDTWTQNNLEAKTPTNFSASVLLDLYQISPIADSGGNPVVDPNTQSANDPAYYVGYFEFKPNGTMTFTRAGGVLPNPPPPPLLTITRSDDTSIITFGTTNGAVYTLFFTNSAGLQSPISSWPSNTNTITGDGLTNRFQDVTTDINRFYRVRAL